jgi:hypothetical protein
MENDQKVSHYTKLILLICAAALFGFSSIVLPSTLAEPTLKPYPLFPAIFTAVDEVSLVSYPLLFLSGVLLGIVDPQRPLILGFSTIAVFPVLAMIEKARIISSHPHYPLEFLFYLFLGCFAVGGAYAGRRFRPRIYQLISRT